MNLPFPEEFYDSAQKRNPWLEELRALLQYRELVRQFVSRNLKTRYKRSALGVLWTLLNPLMTMIVLTLVFSSVFRFQIVHYPVYLLSGLVIWNFFSGSTHASMGEILWSGALLQRIFVPKSAFPVAAVGAGVVNLLISLGLLLVIALFLGVPFTPALLTLPLALILLVLFTLGIGLFLATAAVFFADMLPIYDVLLMIWMYATPIFYPLEIIPAAYQWIFRLNPMYSFVHLVRASLLNGVVADGQTWLLGTLFAVSAFLIGSWVFTVKSKEYAYRV